MVTAAHVLAIFEVLDAKALQIINSGSLNAFSQNTNATTSISGITCAHGHANMQIVSQQNRAFKEMLAHRVGASKLQ